LMDKIMTQRFVLILDPFTSASIEASFCFFSVPITVTDVPSNPCALSML
jgi:hypothetical protein